MDGLTHGMSVEVAKYGIRVSAVNPGLIHTEFTPMAVKPIVSIV